MRLREGAKEEILYFQNKKRYRDVLMVFVAVVPTHGLYRKSTCISGNIACRNKLAKK